MPTCKVFIVCSGLGHVQRGFESFTQECFDALSKDSALDLTLFKGGGDSNSKSIPLWNFPRESWMGAHLGELIKRDSYFIEQSSFFLSLVPHIHLKRPDVIYFSDGNLGNLLWHWRSITKQRYKLLFSNGAPLSPPFDRWDHVQQLTPAHLQIAVEAGTPAEKQSLVPYGISVPSELQTLSLDERDALRKRLGLPVNRPIIISVAAINKSHKRMDYVIKEVAGLPEPRPYLLLVGQQEAESSEVIALGTSLLKNDNFQARSVAPQEVADYYRAADVFTLASLSEGFGRVLLEAMSHGLPCLVHDYEVTRYILEEHGHFADFQIPGNLSDLIHKVLEQRECESKRRLRHRSIYERFGWGHLHSSYIDMIQHCAIT